mmetsp:Transcript_18127/g.31794  ORF Transcript_18127/g.31794 Transcript_18127/m.31794 type:complete len:257 (+) Transcript_18127:358-1128(+)
MGHYLLTQVATLPSGAITAGYGLVGLGGNFVLIGSLQFCELFEQSSTATSVMSGAFQAAAFIFVALDIIDFEPFFAFCCSLCLLVSIAVLFLYPNRSCNSPSLTSRCCMRPEPLNLRSTDLVSSLQRVLSLLTDLRTLLFMLCFAWCSTCSIWGLSCFQISTGSEADRATRVARDHVQHEHPLPSCSESNTGGYGCEDWRVALWCHCSATLHGFGARGVSALCAAGRWLGGRKIGNGWEGECCVRFSRPSLEVSEV